MRSSPAARALRNRRCPEGLEAARRAVPPDVARIRRRLLFEPSVIEHVMLDDLNLLGQEMLRLRVAVARLRAEVIVGNASK